MDKPDKSPWEEVGKEMLEKGLPGEVPGRVGVYVQRSRVMGDTLKILRSDTEQSANESVAERLKDMRVLAA